MELDGAFVALFLYLMCGVFSCKTQCQEWFYLEDGKLLVVQLVVWNFSLAVYLVLQNGTKSRNMYSVFAIFSVTLFSPGINITIDSAFSS